jgi:hypothetical protein
MRCPLRHAARVKKESSHRLKFNADNECFCVNERGVGLYEYDSGQHTDDIKNRKLMFVFSQAGNLGALICGDCRVLITITFPREGHTLCSAVLTFLLRMIL